MSLALLIGMGAAGLAAGIGGQFLQKGKEQQALERQQEREQQAYAYQQQYNNSLYALQRGEAQKQGMIAQNRLAQALGADTEQLNLSLAGQALQAQDAQIAQAAAEGEARAAAGMSGTRGSGALDLQIAYSRNRLAQQQQLQNQSTALGIAGMGRQYSNQFNDIGRELASWNADGFRGQQKTLQDAYAAQMHGLKMQGYDDAIQDVYGDGWDIAFDFGTAAIGGFASGLSFGQSLEKIDWSNPLK